MRRITIVCSLVLCCFVLALSQSNGTSADKTGEEQQLMQLEQDWSAAYLRHDTVTIERILADDYVGTDGRAFVTDKAQEVADAKSPKPGDPTPDFVVLAEDLTDMKVRMYPNVGIVNARSIEKVKFKGKDIIVQYRRTTVWVKKDGGWQCVSFHASRIQE